VVGLQDRTVAKHVAGFQQQLMELVALLPFASEATANDVASYAPVLLQLHKLSRQAHGGDAAGAPAGRV
jgi:hypothetical protein